MQILLYILICGIIAVVMVWGEELFDLLEEIVDNRRASKKEKQELDAEIKRAAIKTKQKEIDIIGQKPGIEPKYLNVVSDKNDTITQIICSCCGDTKLTTHTSIPKILVWLSNQPHMVRWRVIDGKPVCPYCWNAQRMKPGVQQPSEESEYATIERNEF